jgi:shikimate dehydrogenase
MSTLPKFFTLKDLRTWAERGLASSGIHPLPRLAVFGAPVQQSLSPELHTPALAHRGLEMSYIRLLIERDEFREAADLIRQLGFIGTNVTIPHKFSALDYAEVLDPNAAKLGAVNTLHFRDGKAYAYNSDGPGFVRSVEEAFQVKLRDLRVLIIGAGGAGRAVAAQCGIEGVQRLALMNRSEDKLEALAKEMRLYYPAERLRCLKYDEPSLREILPQVDLIVNGTQLGMQADEPDVLPGHLLESRHLVYDMVYKPRVTRLLAAAEAAGCRWVNGLPMLLHQGCVSFEWWFGGEAPVELMRESLYRAAEPSA